MEFGYYVDNGDIYFIMRDEYNNLQKICMGNGSELILDEEEDVTIKEQRFQILCDQCLENIFKIKTEIEAKKNKITEN
jgi:hypothetical protein